MNRMGVDYRCTPYLFYGEQMFNKYGGIQDFRKEIWQETIEYLEKWKETLPDMPEINFDLHAEDVYEEIKGLAPKIYRNLFGNEEIIDQIFPILFPQKRVLKMLLEYFRKQGY